MSMKPAPIFSGLTSMLAIGAPVLGHEQKVKHHHRSHKVQNKQKKKTLRYGYDLYRREVFAKHSDIKDFKTKNTIASSGWKKMSPTEKDVYREKVKKAKEHTGLEQDVRAESKRHEKKKSEGREQDVRSESKPTDLDQELLDLFLENNQDSFLEHHPYSDDSDIDWDEVSRLD